MGNECCTTKTTRPPNSRRYQNTKKSNSHTTQTLSPTPLNINNTPVPPPLPFTDQYIRKVVLKSKNLFEGIKVTYRGTRYTQWVQIDENLLYKGQWEQDLRQGPGLVYNKNEKYLVIGVFYQNKINEIECRKIFHNKTQYIGQLNQNYQMHGTGKLVQNSILFDKFLRHIKLDEDDQLQRQTATFKGTFERDLKIFGIQKNKNSTYQGPFKNNKKQGKGTIIWNSGGKYIGQFHNNLMHGQGKLYDTQGNFCGIRTFQEGKLLI